MLAVRVYLWLTAAITLVYVEWKSFPAGDHWGRWRKCWTMHNVESNDPTPWCSANFFTIPHHLSVLSDIFHWHTPLVVWSRSADQRSSWTIQEVGDEYQSSVHPFKKCTQESFVSFDTNWNGNRSSMMGCYWNLKCGLVVFFNIFSRFD